MDARGIVISSDSEEDVALVTQCETFNFTSPSTGSELSDVCNNDHGSATSGPMSSSKGKQRSEAFKRMKTGKHVTEAHRSTPSTITLDSSPESSSCNDDQSYAQPTEASAVDFIQGSCKEEIFVVCSETPKSNMWYSSNIAQRSKNQPASASRNRGRARHNGFDTTRQCDALDRVSPVVRDPSPCPLIENVESDEDFEIPSFKPAINRQRSSLPNSLEASPAADPALNRTVASSSKTSRQEEEEDSSDDIFVLKPKRRRKTPHRTPLLVSQIGKGVPVTRSSVVVSLPRSKPSSASTSSTKSYHASTSIIDLSSDSNDHGTSDESVTVVPDSCESDEPGRSVSPPRATTRLDSPGPSVPAAAIVQHNSRGNVPQQGSGTSLLSLGPVVPTSLAVQQGCGRNGSQSGPRTTLTSSEPAMSSSILQHNFHATRTRPAIESSDSEPTVPSSSILQHDFPAAKTRPAVESSDSEPTVPTSSILQHDFPATRTRPAIESSDSEPTVPTSSILQHDFPARRRRPAIESSDSDSDTACNVLPCKRWNTKRISSDSNCSNSGQVQQKSKLSMAQKRKKDPLLMMGSKRNSAKQRKHTRLQKSFDHEASGSESACISPELNERDISPGHPGSCNEPSATVASLKSRSVDPSLPRKQTARKSLTPIKRIFSPITNQAMFNRLRFQMSKARGNFLFSHVAASQRHVAQLKNLKINIHDILKSLCDAETERFLKKALRSMPPSWRLQNRCLLQARPKAGSRVGQGLPSDSPSAAKRVWGGHEASRGCPKHETLGEARIDTAAAVEHQVLYDEDSGSRSLSPSLLQLGVLPVLSHNSNTKEDDAVENKCGVKTVQDLDLVPLVPRVDLRTSPLLAEGSGHDYPVGQREPDQNTGNHSATLGGDSGSDSDIFVESVPCSQQVHDQTGHAKDPLSSQTSNRESHGENHPLDTDGKAAVTDSGEDDVLSLLGLGPESPVLQSDLDDDDEGFDHCHSDPVPTHSVESTDLAAPDIGADSPVICSDLEQEDSVQSHGNEGLLFSSLDDSNDVLASFDLERVVLNALAQDKQEKENGKDHAGPGSSAAGDEVLPEDQDETLPAASFSYSYSQQDDFITIGDSDDDDTVFNLTQAQVKIEILSEDEPDNEEQSEETPLIDLEDSFEVPDYFFLGCNEPTEGLGHLVHEEVIDMESHVSGETRKVDDVEDTETQADSGLTETQSTEADTFPDESSIPLMPPESSALASKLLHTMEESVAEGPDSELGHSVAMDISPSKSPLRLAVIAQTDTSLETKQKVLLKSECAISIQKSLQHVIEKVEVKSKPDPGSVTVKHEAQMCELLSSKEPEKSCPSGPLLGQFDPLHADPSETTSETDHAQLVDHKRETMHLTGRASESILSNKELALQHKETVTMENKCASGNGSVNIRRPCHSSGDEFHISFDLDDVPVSQLLGVHTDKPPQTEPMDKSSEPGQPDVGPSNTTGDKGTNTVKPKLKDPYVMSDDSSDLEIPIKMAKNKSKDNVKSCSTTKPSSWVSAGSHTSTTSHHPSPKMLITTDKKRPKSSASNRKAVQIEAQPMKSKPFMGMTFQSGKFYNKPATSIEKDKPTTTKKDSNKSDSSASTSATARDKSKSSSRVTQKPHQEKKKVQNKPAPYCKVGSPISQAKKQLRARMRAAQGKQASQTEANSRSGKSSTAPHVDKGSKSGAASGKPSSRKYTAVKSHTARVQLPQVDCPTAPTPSLLGVTRLPPRDKSKYAPSQSLAQTTFPKADMVSTGLNAETFPTEKHQSDINVHKNVSVPTSCISSRREAQANESHQQLNVEESGRTEPTFHEKTGNESENVAKSHLESAALNMDSYLPATSHHHSLPRKDAIPASLAPQPPEPAEMSLSAPCHSSHASSTTGSNSAGTLSHNEDPVLRRLDPRLARRQTDTSHGMRPPAPQLRSPPCEKENNEPVRNPLLVTMDTPERVQAPAPPPVAKVTSSKDITVNTFLQTLLSWHPSWLEEREKMGPNQLPPLLGMDVNMASSLFPLLEDYDSYDDYREIVERMLLLETWEQVYQSWSDSHKLGRVVATKLLYVQIQTYVKQTQTMTFLYQGLLTREQVQLKRCIGEGDLVILPGLRIDPKNKSPFTFPVLGYVVRVLKNSGKRKESRHHHLGLCLEEGDAFRAFREGVNDPTQLAKLSEETCEKVLRDGGMVLSVDITLKVRKKWSPVEGPHAVKVLDSLVSTLRNMGGLAALPRSLLARDLLRPVSRTSFSHPGAANGPQIQGYNTSQSAVISQVTRSVLEPYAMSRVALVQGPPGTGKSHTIVGLVKSILAQETRDGQRPRILLTAPSNGAIDELLKKLVVDRTICRREVKANIKLVRLGKASSINTSTRCWSLDELVMTTLMKRREQERMKHMSDSVRRQLEKISARRQELLNRIPGFQKEANHSEVRKIEEEATRLEKDRRKILGLPDMDRGPRSRLCSPAEEDQLRREVLVNADVVCCTLNTSGSDWILKLLQPKQLRTVHFTAIIIDEACQCTELDCLIPLQYGCTKLVLVGDPEQLPPTVLSQKAADNKFGQSLFERLYRYFCSKDDNPVLMLDTQYRMHPAICSFPNHHVYHGKLHTDRQVAVRREKFHLKPYLVFDLKYSKEQCGKSISNADEVDAIAALCDYLQRNSMREAQIGIVTPYQQQKQNLQRKLAQRGLSAVEVNTVDGFQGREKDVIILSCVRARSKNENIGFLKDRRRMNVALTRAKYALYIFGHLQTLQVNADWRALTADAMKRRAIVVVNSHKDLHHAFRDTIPKERRRQH